MAFFALGGLASLVISLGQINQAHRDWLLTVLPALVGPAIGAYIARFLVPHARSCSVVAVVIGSWAGLAGAIGALGLAARDWPVAA